MMVEKRKPIPGWFFTTSTVVLALIAVGLAGRFFFGSLSSALDYAAGRRLIVAVSQQSIGTVSPGRQGEATFEMTNFSGRPVVLLGARTNCTCTFAKSLPLTLPPHSSGRVLVAVRGDKVGPIAEQVFFLTDSANDPSLAVSVVGQVEP